MGAGCLHCGKLSNISHYDMFYFLASFVRMARVRTLKSTDLAVRQPGAHADPAVHSLLQVLPFIPNHS